MRKHLKHGKINYFKMDYINYLRKHIGSRIIIVPSAVVLIIWDDYILLQKRKDNNLWGPPAGYVELFEDIKDTAIREVKEETNINLNKEDLELVDVICCPEYNFKYPNGDNIQPFMIIYKTILDDNDINFNFLNIETIGLKKFKLNKLPRDLMKCFGFLHSEKFINKIV